MMGSMEKILLLVSGLVLLASLIGMATMLLASMRERNREIAVLRAVGASPAFVFLLIELEALLIALVGVALALLALWLVILMAQQYLSEQYGLFISANLYSSDTGVLAAVILAATFVMALLPAMNAYRRSVQAGINNNS